MAARVLIVEDNEEILKLEKVLFESEGAEVVAVLNGDDGVLEMQKSINEKKPFDLVVLDIRLPNINGYYVARHIRDIGYKGLIAAFTANATGEGKAEGAESGIDLYFSKAVLNKNLVRAILEQATGIAPSGGASSSDG